MSKIWMQEYGQKTGANRADYKLFYASDEAAIPGLPKLDAPGDWDMFEHSVSTEADIRPVKVGDQVLVWETGELKTMMPDNSWKAMGE